MIWKSYLPASVRQAKDSRLAKVAMRRENYNIEHYWKPAEKLLHVQWIRRLKYFRKWPHRLLYSLCSITPSLLKSPLLKPVKQIGITCSLSSYCLKRNFSFSFAIVCIWKTFHLNSKFWYGVSLESPERKTSAIINAVWSLSAVLRFSFIISFCKERKWRFSMIKIMLFAFVWINFYFVILLLDVPVRVSNQQGAVHSPGDRSVLQSWTWKQNESHFQLKKTLLSVVQRNHMPRSPLPMHFHLSPCINVHNQSS